MSSYNLNSNNEDTDQDVKTEEIVKDEADEEDVEVLQAAKTEPLHHLADEQMQMEEQLEDDEYCEENECGEDDLDYNEEGDEEVAAGLTPNEEEALTGTQENMEVDQEFHENQNQGEEKITDMTLYDDDIEFIINKELTLPDVDLAQKSGSEIKSQVFIEKLGEKTRETDDFYSKIKAEQILNTQIEVILTKKTVKKTSSKPASTDKKAGKNYKTCSKPTLKSQKSTKVDQINTAKLPNPRFNSQTKSKPKIQIQSKSHYNFDSLLSSSNNSSADGTLNLLTKGRKSEPEKGNKARSQSIDKNKPITGTAKITTNNSNNSNNNKNNKTGTANSGKSKNSLQKRNSQTKSLYYQEQQRAKRKGEWITRDTLLLRAKDDLVSVVPPTQGSWGFNAAAMWVDGYPATSGEHYWTVQFGSIGTSDFFAGGRCGVSSRDRMKALKARGLLYGGNVSGHGELTNGSKILVKRFGRAVKSNDRIGILVSFSEDDYDSPQISPTTTSTKSKTGGGGGSGSDCAPGSHQVTSKTGILTSSSGSTIQYTEDPIQGERKLSVYFYHNGRCLGLGFRVPASLFPSGVYPMVQFNVENGSARIWKELKGNIPPSSNRSPVPIKHRGIEGYWKAVGGSIKGADEELAQKFNDVLKRGRMTIDELNFPNNSNNNNNNNNGNSSTTSKIKDKSREYKISVLLQKYRIIFFARKSQSAWTWTFSGYPLGRSGKSEGKTLRKVFKFPETVNLEPCPNGEKLTVVKGKFTINFIRKDFTPFIGNSFREHEAV